MPVQLYYFPASAPCRAVRLVAEAIGLEMELIELNIMAGEHLTPEYEQVCKIESSNFAITFLILNIRY